MKRLYLTHFDLAEPPFSKEIPDAELWTPPSKEALVDDLVTAAGEHESILLVGEPGVGKTCVLRALRHRLPEARFRLTYCHNATLGRRDFYRQLCVALNLAPAATAAALFYAVSMHVQEVGRDNAHPVFLLDEAHLLHQDTLDHLHILLNYAWDSRALLSIVLVGLPELVDRLALRRNRSLYSRLYQRRRIEPLTVEDTADYLRHRLERVGRQPRPSSPPTPSPCCTRPPQEPSAASTASPPRLSPRPLPTNETASNATSCDESSPSTPSTGTSDARPSAIRGPHTPRLEPR